jgi:hypothetical protein
MATKKAAKKVAQTIVMVKPPKQRPRGDKNATAPYRFSSKTPEESARAAAANKLRKTFSGGKGKISEAMSAMLTEKIPEHMKTFLGIDDVPDATWADAISYQTVKRAVGLIDGDKICFTAITELRETTEGKTPEKSEVAGAGGAPLATTPININFIKPKNKESIPNEE